MNLAKKTFISLGLAGLVVCFGLVLIANWNVLGWRAMSVPTGSMDPAIPPGSMVLMHSVPNASLKVGDVITYANPKNMQQTISHRIIKSYKIDNKVPAYITKGDANPASDPIPVVGGQVKGRIVGHVPHLGTWMTWGKGWPAIILMVYIPALIVIIEQFGNLTKYYRSLRPYRIPGFKHVEVSSPHKLRNRAAFTTSVILSFFVIAAPSVKALLVSNAVTLGPNQLTIANQNPNPPNNCQNTNNNTNVNVNNSSSQTATSGNASSSNNTTGGSATSGSASNSNSTSVNININNCTNQ